MRHTPLVPPDGWPAVQYGSSHSAPGGAAGCKALRIPLEHVIENAENESKSASSDRPCFFGYTPDGEYVIVICDELDDDTIYPVTAYVAPEP